MENRKHLTFDFYDKDEYKFIKEKALHYRKISQLHLETFKRTILVYKLGGHVKTVLDYDHSFSKNFDTVEDTLFKHEATRAFGFEKRFLNPIITTKAEFEKELEEYLQRIKR